MIAELVRTVYRALGTGDADLLASALAPDFRASFAAGMPVGGGVTEGREAARERWWAIGRSFAVRAEPSELIPCADGRLLVVGTYRGVARADRHAVDAAFAHLWTARDGRLVELVQITDTARW